MCYVWKGRVHEMDGSIRVSAKTVDDAITEAMIQLGVTSDKLEYEVIEKGSAGFLGIGMKQAVIEARRKKSAEKETDILEEIKMEVKREEKKIFRNDFKKEVKKETKKNTKKSFKEDRDAVKESSVNRESEVNEKNLDKDNKPVKDVEVKEETTGKKNNLKEKNMSVESDSNAKESHPKKSAETVEVTDETKQAVEKFLLDVFKAMGMEVQVTSEIDKDGVLCVDMSGDNMGIIIGKRGQTLDSLQYLANRVANKQQSGYVRVKLDTENYRVRREETLRHLAKNIAHKVKRNRNPIALEPMNPYERRIIHYSLQSDPYVTTHSEGEDPYRKVVVTLKR